MYQTILAGTTVQLKFVARYNNVLIKKKLYI